MAESDFELTQNLIDDICIAVIKMKNKITEELKASHDDSIGKNMEASKTWYRIIFAFNNHYGIL